MRALALATALAAAAPAMAEAPFGGAIGGPWRLVDQTGAVRTEVDPTGRPQLVFFGYAACPGICSHALPVMADLADRLAADGLPVTPVLITIDPALDTPQPMAAALPAIDPDLVGLTGSPAALAAARAAFHVEIERLFDDPAGRPVYAHGAYIYLLDPAGAVLTLLPPVLGVERMAEVVRGYLEGSADG